jgi:hypothetical protein
MEYSHHSELSSSEQLLNLEHIKRLLNQESTEKLLAGVGCAQDIASDISSILKDVTLRDNSQVLNWIKGFEKLQNTVISDRTVIGIVGSTGAGKSSVVNAVLDEECLVPTNCMRACTAAITEICYNDDDDPAKRYKAEVEFIRVEDWADELNILFNDLADFEGQTTASIVGEDTETSIALAKVHAVYPNLDRECYRGGELMVQKLVHTTDVYDILGVTKYLYADSASMLYEQLQEYVDSTGKGHGNLGEHSEGRIMSVWPLVKVVRIFTKSRVLQNGLVIVDLVGFGPQSMKA